MGSWHSQSSRKSSVFDVGMSGLRGQTDGSSASDGSDGSDASGVTSAGEGVDNKTELWDGMPKLLRGRRRRHVAGPESCCRRGCACAFGQNPPWQLPAVPAAASEPRRPLGKRRLRETVLRQRGGPCADVLLQLVPAVPDEIRRIAQMQCKSKKLSADILEKALQPLWPAAGVAEHPPVADAPAFGLDASGLATWWLRTCGEPPEGPAKESPTLPALEPTSAPMGRQVHREVRMQTMVIAGFAAAAGRDGSDSPPGDEGEMGALSSCRRGTMQETAAHLSAENGLIPLFSGDLSEAAIKKQLPGNRRSVVFRRSSEVAEHSHAPTSVAEEDDGSQRPQGALMHSPKGGQLEGSPQAPWLGSTGHADGTGRRCGRVLRSTVFDRLGRISARRMAIQHLQKASDALNNLRRQFNELPAAEHDAIQKAFGLFANYGRDKLDAEQAILALRELGLRGSSLAEKQEILRLCRQFCDTNLAGGSRGSIVSTRSSRASMPMWSAGGSLHMRIPEGDDDSDDGDIDIYTFALELVPQVRSYLTQTHSADAARCFYLYDAQGIGKLRLEQLIDIGRALRLDLRILRRCLDQRGRAHKGSKKDKTVDLDQFLELVAKCKEEAHRSVRNREREIKDLTGLSDSVFEEFQQDLAQLYDLFSRFDVNQNGSLDEKEVRHIFSEFGAVSRTLEERLAYEHMLEEADVNNDGNFTFDEFLHLLKQVREYHKRRRQQDVANVFDKHDKDKTGELSIQEISRILNELGAAPRTRKEQDELASLIRQADEDGSGTLDLQEFGGLFVRIEERLKSTRYEDEVQHGLRLGFSENMLSDLRFVFEKLDSDCSGSLSLQEAHSCMKMLGKKVPQDVFENAFNALDDDGSGEMEFKEFLGFVKMVGESDNAFNEDSAALPVKVPQLEKRVVRLILEIFGQSKAYSSSLSKQEEIDLACVLLDIQPNQNFQEVLKVKSISDLIDVAKARAADARAKLVSSW